MVGEGPVTPELTPIVPVKTMRRLAWDAERGTRKHAMWGRPVEQLAAIGRSGRVVEIPS